MALFKEKSIFIWHPELIEGGDPDKIADLLVAANFEAAYLHTTNGIYIPTTNGKERFGTALVNALKQRLIVVYGWGAVYGVNPLREAQLAAEQVERYELGGHTFDAETGWEQTADGVLRSDAVANTRILTTEYKRLLPDSPLAWCWWPIIRVPGKTQQYHPKAILTEAMKLCEYGMPMAYWSWGDDPASAVRYLNEVNLQWREVTQKPLVFVGRACVGDGGKANGPAVIAFEKRARELGTNGISWWDMWHALDSSVVPGVWDALAVTPKLNSGTIPEVPMTDWTGNAIGLYTKQAGWTNKAFRFIVGYAGGDWSQKNGQLVLEPNAQLKPIETQAHGEDKPFLALWDFDVDYYRRQQIDAKDDKWPSEKDDYPLQALIGALTSRDVDGLIIRVMNRKNVDGGNEMMAYVAFAARKFVERANRWLYTHKGLNKWTFVLTNDDFLRTKEADGSGAQESFYTWLKDWYLGIEQEATRPLASGAWPQPTDAIKAVPPSLGWKLWYHYNATSLDMMIFNGTNEDMQAWLGYGVEQPPVDTTPPAKPVVTSQVIGGTVTLQWLPVADAATYSVYDDNGDEVSSTSGLSLSRTGHVPGIYQYGVSAVDAAGNESEVAWLDVIIPNTSEVTLEMFEALVARVAELERWRRS